MFILKQHFETYLIPQVIIFVPSFYFILYFVLCYFTELLGNIKNNLLKYQITKLFYDLPTEDRYFMKYLVLSWNAGIMREHGVNNKFLRNFKVKSFLLKLLLITNTFHYLKIIVIGTLRSPSIIANFLFT